MPVRKQQQWSVGDVFVIGLRDNSFAVGQIVGREAEVLNSISVALFDKRVDEPSKALDGDRSESRAFAILFATRDLLDQGVWPIVGARPVQIPSTHLPFESTRSAGFVGAKVIGSKIIAELANAFFGLVPWDDWQDPHYLDKLLVAPDRLPANRVLTNPLPSGIAVCTEVLHSGSAAQVRRLRTCEQGETVRQVTKAEMDGVLRLDGPARFKHFVKFVADTEQAWGLWKDGWALLEDDERSLVFPLWPAREYAEQYRTGDWADYEPSEIALKALLEDLLPKLLARGTKLGVFPTPQGKGVTLEALEFEQALREELSKYG